MAPPCRHNRSVYRESILAYLQGERIHATAEEIHRELLERYPHVSLGTVYRNLGILVEQGEVNRLSGNVAGDLFEARREPHSHVVCERCGTVADTGMHITAQLNNRAAVASGYEIKYHRITFYGICARCRAESRPQSETQTT